MSINRREFLKGTAWMGLAATAAGCHMGRLGFGQGGTMQNFVYQKLAGKRLKIGFVGIGGRGSGAVHRVAQIPGCDIVALCDLLPECVEENLKWLKENCSGSKANHNVVDVDKIKKYVGPEAYKELCDFGDCDIVYCATPWALHQPVALRALNGGKLPLVEVTSALTVDECWELVEASEKWRIPCMQLENCVYGEIELLELNLARLGMFGEITNVEGAYIHDLRSIIPQNAPHNNEFKWRYWENMAHRGDRYPTHGLVPLCQTLGVNRGDRLDYLVAMGNHSSNRNYECVRKEYLPDSDSRKFDPPAAMADMNKTLIKTVNGVLIEVLHDVSSPRPYNRKSFISGTKGAMGDYPFRCAFESKCMETYDKTFPDGYVAKIPMTHEWFSEEKAKAIKEKYMHPLIRDVQAMAAKVGGHGGMDFIMDLRWAYCLQNGLPLDMDVYDLAATSCLCELTEVSDRNKSKPVDIPDFTRGNWKNVEPWGVVTVDLKKMGLGIENVQKDNAALST